MNFGLHPGIHARRAATIFCLSWPMFMVPIAATASGYAETRGRVPVNWRGGEITLHESRIWTRGGGPFDVAGARMHPIFRSLSSGDTDRAIHVADGDAKFEATLWNMVRESNSAADYEAYLELFPNGRFAAQARESLARLKQGRAGKTADRPRGAHPAIPPKIDRIGQTYSVRVNANLRQAPSTKSRVVGYARKGSKLFVIGRVAGRGWYQVSTEARATAYIAASLLQESDSRAATPAPTSQGTAPRKKRAPTAEGAGPEPASSDPNPPLPRDPATRPAASASGDTQSPPTVRPTSKAAARTSREEIERYWTRQIDIVKETGLYGDCDLVVDNPRTDPPAYSDCEANNDKIEAMTRKMEQELAGRR